LGGTSFVGRHLVAAALEREHEVTVFNRGRTNPGLWADVEELRGDRDGELGALKGHRWDAVVDTSGYVPRVVHASAKLLRDAVRHYTFISSVSVYADFRRGPDETGAVEQLAVADNEDVEQHYGALKAECERTVEEVFPDAALIVRPGLIVGPWDRPAASRTGQRALRAAATCSSPNHATFACNSSMRGTSPSGSCAWPSSEQPGPTTRRARFLVQLSRTF